MVRLGFGRPPGGHCFCLLTPEGLAHTGWYGHLCLASAQPRGSVLCLAHPPQYFSGCLFRDLTAERQRLTPPAAPRTSPVCLLRPPGAGKGLTTHTPPMRRSLCSRGEGPCHGADPRYRKPGRPSSFPGLSARGCQPGVCAWGSPLRAMGSLNSTCPGADNVPEHPHASPCGSRGRNQS